MTACLNQRSAQSESLFVGEFGDMAIVQQSQRVVKEGLPLMVLCATVKARIMPTAIATPSKRGEQMHEALVQNGPFTINSVCLTPICRGRLGLALQRGDAQALGVCVRDESRCNVKFTELFLQLRSSATRERWTCAGFV